jgi:hypothetical protein
MGEWGESGYERACTTEETAILGFSQISPVLKNKADAGSSPA